MEALMAARAEEIRRALLVEINSAPADRPDLEARVGPVWDAAELLADFEVLAFQAPLVVVRRKHDRRLGSLFFQHHPRFYFAFQEDT